MAYVVFGQRTAGRVDEFDGNYVVSHFGHANGLVFGFVASQLVLAEKYRFDIPRHRRSVIAAYLRIWPFAFAAAALFMALVIHELAAWVQLSLTAIAFVALGTFGLRMGRVSTAMAARLRVYRSVTGWAVDPALLVYGMASLEEHLQDELEARSKGLAPGDYRDALTEWTSVAQRGAGGDASYLAIAMTLARIQGRDLLVEELWQHLEPRASDLPPLIELLAHPQRELIPAAESTAYPSVRRLPDQASEVVEAGFDVTLDRALYAPPAVCASCLAPAEHTRRTSVGWPSRHAILVPYCGPCAAHGSRMTSQAGGIMWLTYLSAVGGACVVGTLSASLKSAIAIGSALAIPISAIVPLVFRPRRASAPATVMREAARLVAATSSSIVVYCSNEEWSRRLAEHFGGSSSPRRRMDLRPFRVVLTVALTAPIAAMVAWVSKQ